MLIAAQTALGIILLATGVLVAATFQQASRRDMAWLYAAVAAATLVMAGSIAALTASRRIVRSDPARTLQSS